ncbi:hypothetical protein EV361DRAFT_889492 [Lentinula raphanica]|nr:hypothetical protein EV361DRAFT_889492 [Lentinula raphanica]
MPSYSLCHRLSGWFDRRIRTALYSHWQAPWRRRLAVYATIINIASLSGSAYASYKTNPKLSLGFTIISIIVSAVQSFLSQEVSKLIDPEEHPLSSVSTTVYTGAIPSLPVAHRLLGTPPSASRVHHSPPSSLPVVRGELQHRDRTVPTNHEFPSAEGGNKASLEPDNDWNGPDAPGVWGTSSLPSPQSGLSVEEEPEHVEQIVSTNYKSPYSSESSGESQASLESENDSTDGSGADVRITSSSSSPPSGLMDGDLDHAEHIVPTNDEAPFAEGGNEASLPTQRKSVNWSTHIDYAPPDPIFNASERAGYSTSVLMRTNLSSSRISSQRKRGSSSQGHESHSSSESDRSDADDSE